MKYSVQQLAKLSGVTVRTLHYYDEIELLKPATVEENGYRYYGREQLLKLQQILFYRELGFPLSDIHAVLKSPDFDKIKALVAHRQNLVKSNERTNQLIATIDKTIAHLKEGNDMAEKDYYFGFAPEKQAEYEQELVQRYKVDPQQIQATKDRMKGWSKDDFSNVREGYQRLHEALSECLQRGQKVTEASVQKLIGEHFALVSRFYTPTRTGYRGLGQMYCEHADFRKTFDTIHPHLAEYLAQAMTEFAERELS